MKCAEFQRVLPYIIETGGNVDEEQHLQECRVCSDLVQDLRYIAEQAKLLVPMEDPSPHVWDGIRDGLEREGLVKKPARARGRLLGSQPTVPWIAGVVALLFVLGGIVLYRRAHETPTTLVGSYTPFNPTEDYDAQDQQVVAAVADSRPEMKDTYETNLKQVNASIRESKQALQRDPADDDARSGLLRAYEQKAMVYAMAARASR